jgi:hypothetical protein
LHFFPHFPQLSLSVITLTQCLLQQSGPGLALARQTIGYTLQVPTCTRWAEKRPFLARNDGCSLSGKGCSLALSFFLLAYDSSEVGAAAEREMVAIPIKISKVSMIVDEVIAILCIYIYAYVCLYE